MGIFDWLFGSKKTTPLSEKKKTVVKETIKKPAAKKPAVKTKKGAYHELIKKSDTNLENELSELNETFGDDIFDIFCQHTSLTRESLKKTLLTDLKKSLADGGKYMTESGKSLKDFSQESMDTSVEFIAKYNFDEGLGAVKTLLHKPIFHLANPDFFLNTYGYIKIERGETKEGLFLAIKCIYFSKFSIKNNLYSSDIDFQNLIVNALDTFAFGLTNLKEYSDALVLYNKVIDLAPNHSEIAEHFTNRGKCKLKLGDKKGAKIDFKKGNYL